MSANETIRLLILNDSRTEVERLISMLNNAGHPTRAKHVESEEALTKLLQEQPWDLMIAHESSTNLTPSTAVRQIKRLNKDVPLILVSEEGGPQVVVDGLKMGAADVVQLDQDQHLLLIIQREMFNREQRQLKRHADRKLKEVERRNQLLLDSSRDAIAYVQDGMYLYANQSFAERFGYIERDDIECMPVIDMVADSSQDQVKQFLKEYTLKGDEAETCQLSFHGLRFDGSPCSLNIAVANAIYDEEACIQFLIPSQQADNEELQAELQKIKDQDLVTGLYNRQYLVEQLEAEANNAVNHETCSSLLYIEVDNFTDHIQSLMGVAGSDLVLGDVAAFIKERTESHQTLARFGNNAFMLLAPQQGADDSLEKARTLVDQLGQHIVEIEGKTVQLTVTIGIALINETSSSTETAIDHALRAVEIYREQHEGNGSGVQLFEPEVPAAISNEKEMSRALQAALDNNRFQLLFQPIISLRGAEDELYEVLLRMLDEQGELVSPVEFMDMAAHIDATTKIDRWVILEAIKMLSEHRSQGHKTRAIINLSRQSLCDETLVPWLSVAFKAAKLPTDAIVFQVDEVDVTNHLTTAKSFFEALSEIRCFSSISNFGCSLNPFNTLQHAPSDYVKVHGSFTLDIQNNNESPETLSNLIKQLLEANKISIVPFVENASVLSVLWQTGVHYIQGHYLQAPTTSMDYDFTMEG